MQSSLICLVLGLAIILRFFYEYHLIFYLLFSKALEARATALYYQHKKKNRQYNGLSFNNNNNNNNNTFKKKNNNKSITFEKIEV